MFHVLVAPLKDTLPLVAHLRDTLRLVAHRRDMCRGLVRRRDTVLAHHLDMLHMVLVVHPQVTVVRPLFGLQRVKELKLVTMNVFPAASVMAHISFTFAFLEGEFSLLRHHAG
jgi:hypothetical protein